MTELLIPDRYESLSRSGSGFKTIITPVEEALAKIDDIYEDLVSAGRGAFLIFRGDSGSGKSTFLHTLNFFREDVEIISIDGGQDLIQALSNLTETNNTLRVIVIEGREALGDTTIPELEKALHLINTFLRSRKLQNSNVLI